MDLKKSTQFIIATVLLNLIFSFKADNAIKIKYTKTFTTAVPEPSDACLSANEQSLFVVSDDGFLFETDLEGKILRKSNVVGIDFEAICLANDLLYISDESARKIYCVNPVDLTIHKTFNLNYSAGRNSGFEAIASNEASKLFYLVSEKSPIVIRVYNELFQQVNEINFDATSDISGACYFQNNLWLLSDEEHLMMQLDENYKVVKQFDFKILNPEGFFFNKQGDLTVISDDMAKLYQFEATQLK
jgi:uncharacterized protein YjiK